MNYIGIKYQPEYLQVITLVSLLFISMIPIACKIANFSLHLFVSFLKEIKIITSWRVPSY